MIRSEWNTPFQPSITTAHSAIGNGIRFGARAVEMPMVVVRGDARGAEEGAPHVSWSRTCRLRGTPHARRNAEHQRSLDDEDPLVQTPSDKRNARPVLRRLHHLGLLLLVVAAIVMAFPRVIGSDDDPSYALTVCFLALAVVFWVRGNPRSSSP